MKTLPTHNGHPYQLGKLYIERALGLVSDQELEILSTKLKWGRLVILLASRSAQIKEDSKGKFQNDQVKGNINLTKPIEIPPFQIVHAHALSKVKRHKKV